MMDDLRLSDRGSRDGGAENEGGVGIYADAENDGGAEIDSGAGIDGGAGIDSDAGSDGGTGGADGSAGADGSSSPGDGGGDSAPDANCTSATHDSHVYWFCPEGTAAVTAADATAACQSVGLFLVKIDDASENAFVNDNRSGEVWLGLKDLAGDDQWIWKVDGSTADYTNWNPGEPSNTYLREDQDCVMMGYAFTGFWDEERWTDTDCGSEHGYVCEAD